MKKCFKLKNYIKSLKDTIMLWIKSKFHDIYRHFHLRKMRRLVVKRAEELQRVIHIVIGFNENDASTSYSLKVKGMVISTLSNKDGEYALQNFVAQANKLRIKNRHNIDYKKL